jgi:phosphatidylglycerol:prolipoprotein diacylglycerol transferase
MHQTLLMIPHWLFEGPLLIAWLILGVVTCAYLFQRHGSSSETWSFLPVFGIIALVIHFVLPQLEVIGVNPDDPAGPFIKQGLALRGYGVFLLLAIVAGVGVTLTRCRKSGVSPDQILGLGFWLMVMGIVGARLFFVIQKSEDFFEAGVSLRELIVGIVDMTKGGLVVYGSLFGGMLAAVVYLKLQKLPFWRTADLIAPGMVLGLAIGRIGCLMNGCCYGGVCDAPLPSVTFPAGSAPYMTQLSDGELIGIKARPNDKEDAAYPLVAEEVREGSLAHQLGLKPGDEFYVMTPHELHIRFQKENPGGMGKWNDDRKLVGFVQSERLGQLPFPVADLPARSLNIHPAQIYSSINAGLLFLVLWFFWTIRRSEGEVFGLMLVLYSIGRFLMELIREDEMGAFGTPLTISQWVSLITILVGFAILAYARSGGSRSTEAPALAS